ncbi:MAG: recombinase family protein [Myxococcales bacterium]|nr:recombinase family protein [Myxococcales bacterium]
MAKTQQIRAIGYVRVSTDMQAQEGVSLDSQKLRIQAHCTAMDIHLVEIMVDAGESAKSLDRPGIQKALKILTQGKADALIVMKLDRLTRSVKDLGVLCETYFGEGKPWSLLSVSDSIDTRSASGKLILNVLTSVAQWEREALADRVREAMQHMKSQGVFLGAAPYGWKYSEEVDAHGRRKLVERPEEQSGIKRICELYETDMYVWQICEQLEAEKVPPRGPHWHRATVYRVLRRAGYEDPDGKPRKSEPSRQQRDAKRVKAIIRDKAQASVRAAELRAQGLSLRKIGERLCSDNLLPPRGEVWHAASILDLLRSVAPNRPLT